MRKPKVYLVNKKQGYSTQAADIFGEVTLLYEGQPSDVFSTSRHAFQIKQKLKDAESSDYLIVGGNAILCLIAFGILLERFGFVNLLLYDVRTLTYTARAIPRYQLAEVNNG